MPPSKPGPKPRLTPAVQSAIADALRAGDSRRNAASLAGISQSSLFAWLAEARANPESPYAGLLQAVEAAEAEFEHSVILALKQQTLGQPHQRTRTVTRQTTRPAVSPADGKPLYDDVGEPIMLTTTVRETVVTETTPRSPRVALEWLRRRHPEEWAAAIPSAEPRQEEDDYYQQPPAKPLELSSELLYGIYQDALEVEKKRREAAPAGSIAAAATAVAAGVAPDPVGAESDRARSVQPQRPLRYRCGPVGQPLVPNLRPARAAIGSPLRPLPAPGRIPPLARKPRG